MVILRRALRATTTRRCSALMILIPANGTGSDPIGQASKADTAAVALR